MPLFLSTKIDDSISLVLGVSIEYGYFVTIVAKQRFPFPGLGTIVVMGLLTGYLAYRHGKKKAERKARACDEWNSDDECENCGYLASQHSEEGQCPTYD